MGGATRLVFTALTIAATHTSVWAAEVAVKASDEPLADSRVRIRSSFRSSAKTNARGTSPLKSPSVGQKTIDKLKATLSPTTSRETSRTLKTPRYMACMKGGKRRPIADYQDDGEAFWLHWIGGGQARYGKTMIDRFESLTESQAAEVLAEYEATRPPDPDGQPKARQKKTGDKNDSVARPETKNRLPRPYSAGPLKPEDFAGRPPAGRLETTAYTYTAINYSYRYHTIVYPAGVEVRPTSATALALMFRDKSWNRNPSDARLLDHEQGHFDITQLRTSEWQTQLEAHIRQRSLWARGVSEAAAYKQLQTAIERGFQTVWKSWEAEQRQYDDETRHGLDARQQSTWRKRLDSELQRGPPSILSSN